MLSSNNRFKLRYYIDRIQRKMNIGSSVFDSWAQYPEKTNDLVEFLSWFDQTDSIETTKKNSVRDWKKRFVETQAYQNLQSKKVALEIGFGGGRLLAESSQDFDQVIGVDIHNSFSKSKEYLKLQKRSNFELVHRDHVAKIPDQSVDFLYSFIVFQHFESFKEVQFYLDLIERVLSPNGVAVIYFGKTNKSEIHEIEKKSFELRGLSLLIEPNHFESVIKEKFEIIESKRDLYRDPEAKTGNSVQALVSFRRKK